MIGSFAQPVALAKLLASNGLGLAKAHDAIGALVNDRTVTVTLRSRDLEGLIESISAMGLAVSVEERKGKVSAIVT